MLDILDESLSEEGTAILTFFGFTFAIDDSHLSLLLEFSVASDYVVLPPSFPLIAFYFVISSIMSMTKILLGVPLFSLLFIVYAIIGFRCARVPS